MREILKKIIVAILTFEARLVLFKYKPKVVAVTGNVGKTSTKDAIYSVMSSRFFVRKSEKSFNSEIGIPLTIIGCQNGWSNPFIWIKNIIEGFLLIVLKNHYPAWLILEVGADRPGDIKSISRWLKPDIVVVTRVPDVPVHVEYFNDKDHLLEEKRSLVYALKSGGTLILNADDINTAKFEEETQNSTITYSMMENGAINASRDEVRYKRGIPVGLTYRVDYGGSSAPVKIEGSVGRQQIYSTLGAVAVGVALNMDLVSIGKSLELHATPPGRMRILKGIKKTLIIDDSYNSSPVALTEALLALKRLETTGRKIAVLGDMMEIGVHTAEEHKKAGKQVAETADILLTVGMRSRHIAEGAQNNGMSEKNIFQYDDSERAGKELELLLKEGDMILVKGSQSPRLEKTVLEVMKHPERREELLVRQDAEWMNR
ncbi:MAG: UDP-N-acetylmuramoyl-tripeptide--D-alanyl-D-alanine ligase [Candidatus Pacebacteria bacterium]|jgi:UDP-N-acetylmuramoyl-tripeptide--D-alanyl-D-alanine ligase|nr:hypothetical protein [bacterium]MDP6527276.1 UDP-N-acetylmuramoyl-tripeptide--D-alanyl-D-alanine ligase [Candidatus Paceibacterota bacterium]MDP6659686.1 UDP-N-acetylmuramoyl-tripeptide--D-alanyl-D-alanine ligase [Candidatus Paceibacterota bacterium]|tara:strand:+ start:25451 stop:26740 length:1290 start_codon:yes stop_codon:yes gene_type:complete